MPEKTTFKFELDDTEVQMVYEALSRVKPFAEMSETLFFIEKNLEAKFLATVREIAPW